MITHPTSQQFGAVSIEARTYGEESLILAGQSQTLHHVLGDVTVSRILDRQPYQFARHLLKYPDIPQFSADIQIATGVLQSDRQVINLFKDFRECVPHTLASHFIRFGNGKGTQYAALTDNQDVSRVCESGRKRTLAAGITNDRVRNRRLKVYDDLEEYFENPEAFEKQGKRKRIVAGAATAIVVGAAGIVYVNMNRSEGS